MMRPFKLFAAGALIPGLLLGLGACANQENLPDAQLPDYQQDNAIEGLKPEPIRPAPMTDDDKDDELLGGPE